MTAVFLVLAVVFAGVASACAAYALAGRYERERRVYEAKMRDVRVPQGEHLGIDDRLVAYAETLSATFPAKGAGRVRAGCVFAGRGPAARMPADCASAERGRTERAPGNSKRNGRWFLEHAKKAGLAERITPLGFKRAQCRAAGVGLLAGAAMGAVFSAELAILLALLSVALGWAALPWAVLQQERRRAEELERRLSEMLEVVALGLRSGLSFDRGLQLYIEHFDSLLARSCASAKRQWSLGLKTREEALRALADSYSSPLFGRVIDGVVRSLRFGASLACDLEGFAAEAREAYRARKQEQVAKAPVKMMVPTGALMLPAMLLLVMGPVLLELMGGF